MSRLSIALNYLAGMGIIDIISTIPFDLIIALKHSDKSSIGYLRILRVLRLFKLLRIVRSSRVLKRLQDQVNFHYRHARPRPAPPSMLPLPRLVGRSPPPRAHHAHRLPLPLAPHAPHRCCAGASAPAAPCPALPATLVKLHHAGKVSDVHRAAGALDGMRICAGEKLAGRSRLQLCARACCCSCAAHGRWRGRQKAASGLTLAWQRRWLRWRLQGRTATSTPKLASWTLVTPPTSRWCHFTWRAFTGQP